MNRFPASPNMEWTAPLSNNLAENLALVEQALIIRDRTATDPGGFHSLRLALIDNTPTIRIRWRVPRACVKDATRHDPRFHFLKPSNDPSDSGPMPVFHVEQSDVDHESTHNQTTGPARSPVTAADDFTPPPPPTEPPPHFTPFTTFLAAKKAADKLSIDTSNITGRGALDKLNLLIEKHIMDHHKDKDPA